MDSRSFPNHRHLSVHEASTCLGLDGIIFYSRGLQHLCLPELVILELNKCILLEHSAEDFSVFAIQNLLELALHEVNNTEYSESYVEAFLKKMVYEAKNLNYLDVDSLYPLAHAVSKDIVLAVNLQILVHENLVADFIGSFNVECRIATDIVFFVNNLPKLQYIRFDPSFLEETFFCNLFEFRNVECKRADNGKPLCHFQFSRSESMRPTRAQLVRRIRSALLEFPALQQCDWDELYDELYDWYSE